MVAKPLILQNVDTLAHKRSAFVLGGACESNQQLLKVSSLSSTLSGASRGTGRNGSTPPRGGVSEARLQLASAGDKRPDQAEDAIRRGGRPPAARTSSSASRVGNVPPLALRPLLSTPAGSGAGYRRSRPVVSGPWRAMPLSCRTCGQQDSRPYSILRGRDGLPFALHNSCPGEWSLRYEDRLPYPCVRCQTTDPGEWHLLKSVALGTGPRFSPALLAATPRRDLRRRCVHERCEKTRERE